MDLKKRKSPSLDRDPYLLRSRVSLEPTQQASSPVEAWLSDLPESGDFERLRQPDIVSTMSQPPRKRRRLEDDTNITASSQKTRSTYSDSMYEINLANKGSFMKPLPEGMVDEDKKLWDQILTTAQPVPDDLLFDDDHFKSFLSNLRTKSELRVSIDLHPRVVPSVENLFIAGREEFSCFIEGYNNAWLKCLPFYGSRPQPDHTVAFKPSSFTERQRQKLSINPTQNSYFIAQEELYFPFFTSEVKCSLQPIEIADRANAHSMTVAIRGIVEVYIRAGRAADIHRRLAGISISHNEKEAYIYAHYPEIENDLIRYWRTDEKHIVFNYDNGRERHRCYQITLNVYQMFGLPLLQRLLAVIDDLPDPGASLPNLTAILEEQSTQDDTSGLDSQTQRLVVELQSGIQKLEERVEQQKQDMEERAEQQKQDMEKKATTLLARLEQQRQEAHQERQDLMSMLSEQARQQTEQISKLLSKQ